MRKNGRFPQILLLTLLLILVLASVTADPYVKAAFLPAVDMDTYIVLFEEPSVVGRLEPKEVQSINAQSLAVQMARRAVQAQQAVAIAEMTQVLQRPLTIPHQYTIALNGLAVALTASEAAEIAAQPGVDAVVPSQTRFPQTDAGPTWIGAPGLWDGSQTGGIAGTLGEGSIIGIIDTGINLDHPSFAAVGGDGYVHTNPRGAGNYLGHCASQPATSICNDKLIGAYSWPETGDNPEDDYGSGHGSNVAGIAAGNIISAAYTAPTTVLTAALSGVAPHANLIAYDVCLGGSCPDEISLLAVEQAILDGVDVLNFSIGSDATNPWEDPLSLAFLSAREAGIFVATSAGNSGPGAGTILSPGNSPWMTAAGNTAHNGRFNNTLIPLSGGNNPLPSPITGSSITGGTGPAPIVAALGVTNTSGTPDNGTCQANFAAGTWLAAEIVFCRSGGGVSAAIKANRVLAGGAGGVIIDSGHNVSQAMGIDRLNLPGMNIRLADADVLAAWLASGANHTAKIQGTVRQYDASYADELYFQSSRGPAEFVADVLKPNVSAPGVLIWSAGISTTASSTPPEWSFYRGTSQASPHVAGAAALLTVLHPDWTPAEIESALMTTAVSTITENDGTPAGVFGRGAGRIDLTAVSRAGLLLEETGANFRAANPAFGPGASQLNLASLTAVNCGSACVWTRRLRNPLAVPTTWNIDITQPITAVLSVTPTTLTLLPGETKTMTVTAVVSDLPLETWDFGAILLTETTGQAPDAHLPVAANHINNAPPSADAGDNQTVTINQLVTLDGSGSSDVNIGQTLSYSWVQTGGPAVSLSDTTAVSPTFTAPASPTAITFTLTVTDSYGLDSSPSEVVVTVQPYTVFLPVIVK